MAPVKLPESFKMEEGGRRGGKWDVIKEKKPTVAGLNMEKKGNEPKNAISL